MTDVQGESILRGYEKRCRELIAGLPIYHAGRKVYELDKDLGDGEQIIYVNAGVQDDTELGRLMHDLHCKNADEMYSTVLVFGSVSNTCCLMRQNMSRE